MRTARAFLASVGVVAVLPASAVAQTTTFSYTGDQQTYFVPAGYSYVKISAIGAAGGGPSEAVEGQPGSGLPGGRGAIVSGIVAVRPGQALYVLVGGKGSKPSGGFNGGASGGVKDTGMSWGGGGASDVRTIPIGDATASLGSRVLVAAGGGGSAAPAAGGGDAGAAGGCCGSAGTGPGTAKPGTQTTGGAGGCGEAGTGCGASGTLGSGGAGGASGTGADLRTGGGGGGGLYGGGGGGGGVDHTGGGAGGSSLVPPSGSITLADLAAVARVQITPYTPPRCDDGFDNDADGVTDFPFDPGCVSVSDDDETDPPDIEPPPAALYGPTRQQLRRVVRVLVSCESAKEDCIASGSGTLRVRRRGEVIIFNLRPARTKVIGPGQVAAMRFGLRPRSRRAAARALALGKKVRVRLRVRVADVAGNLTKFRRDVEITR